MSDECPVREICRHGGGAKGPSESPCTGGGDIKRKGQKPRIHLVRKLLKLT